VGITGAGNRPVGFVAVNSVRAASLLAVLLLAGCKATPEIAGVVAGGVAGAASANPAVGFAVGVATDAAATAGLNYIGRSRQGAEQDAIAHVAGELEIGAQADWKIEHTIPIGNEHGRLRITRTIDSPLATCKEVVFSVENGTQPSARRDWYITDICKTAGDWKWAAAEPAVQRWGVLQ
jgi:hypothetical protein